MNNNEFWKLVQLVYSIQLSIPPQSGSDPALFHLREALYGSKQFKEIEALIKQYNAETITPAEFLVSLGSFINPTTRS